MRFNKFNNPDYSEGFKDGMTGANLIFGVILLAIYLFVIATA